MTDHQCLCNLIRAVLVMYVTYILCDARTSRQKMNTLVVVLIVALVLARANRVSLSEHMTATSPVLPPSQAAIRMHRVQLDKGSLGESLILRMQLFGQDSLMMLDTGYAGPPVLSTSYLSWLSTSQRERASITDAYRAAIKGVRRASQGQRNAAIARLVSRGDCHAYTSGCTMRLMGIGSITEQQADLLLVPPIAFECATQSNQYVSPRAHARVHADVMVTNPLPHSVHILTTDYLFHCAPCLIQPEKQILDCHLPPARVAALGMIPRKLTLAGGAVVVQMTVGGASVTATMDTGAPGAISLGRQVLHKLKCNDESRVVRQVGVNAETICSSIVSADVEFYGHSLKDVAVFVNDTPVDAVDGYVGMGFLRAFDILLQKNSVSFSPSGLLPRKASEYATDALTSAGMCTGMTNVCNAD